MHATAARLSLSTARSVHALRGVSQRRSFAARASLDPKATAVVLIEYQNDFTTPNGKLHDAVKGVMASTNMLQNTIKTVDEARKKGALIVHAPITFSDDYKEISGEFGILGNVKKAGAFKKSEWGGAIVDILAPATQDVVVEGKRGLCGFASTNLDFILRQRGIKTIALGGFLTNCCVESTMRSAYEKGYEVVTLTDCVAATSEAEQEAAIKFTYPMFSKPVTHEQFLKELS
mmetsp:Transcript_32451/g.71681  ORF Transcript_32451/g.71681 Transcript_32451/m.71681 type:complete len:232 (+) Transcript_32451:46-741(+)|eukprot:CAMPEP_0202900952 /NCGR_PEP_ID=MMETSP1392-20130828/12341_1 /ASSEMBLY_ACC=CAM_ASM_000868 /TAXON_ID=225041 /ORGANISM="Chlamydomonas chlamydogama, Strain SAG 11-48b" /LENGTH=231 /DNA_ID=CAMNT_0049587417 /DNA_START=43 /DNA_END=738 /DNA_ORIENTATION=+